MDKMLQSNNNNHHHQLHHMKMLSTSTSSTMKVSSSEYFSILFDIDNRANSKESRDRDEVFIPATKGVTLL